MDAGAGRIQKLVQRSEWSGLFHLPRRMCFVACEHCATRFDQEPALYVGHNMGDLKQRFGNLVAAHRRRVGWTQHRLAEAANLSDDMIARIETESTGVSFETIERLAAALQVDEAELFTSELADGALQRSAAANLIARIGKLKAD